MGASACVTTKKPAASERYCSEFVLFAAVYSTNLGRSPSSAQVALRSLGPGSIQHPIDQLFEGMTPAAASAKAWMNSR